MTEGEVCIRWGAKEILAEEQLSLGRDLKLVGHTVVDTPTEQRLHFVVMEALDGWSTGERMYRFAVYQDGRNSAHCSLLVDREGK